MDREQVDSSQIASIGYDIESKTLEIEFKSGGVYDYHDVPQHVYMGIMSAGSHGKYFYAEIKGKYGFEKVS